MERGVVGCGFTYENDLTRALDMRPVPIALSFRDRGGTIQTAWFGTGGDCCYNVFGSPDPIRDRHRPWGEPDLSGAVWDMFIEWLSSHHPEDFGRMYDPDYGFPVRGYPIPDPASIELWERYTDEFVASPQELARSFETEADRATMDRFVPLAERWTELFRGEGSPDWFFNERKHVENRMDRLIPGCLIHGFGG